MNQCSYLMACMFSVLYQAAGVCSEVLIVASDADLQRSKYLFLDQSLPLIYIKCRNSLVQPTHALHAERLHADSFRPESNIAVFAWHNTEDNKLPPSEES